MTRFQVYAAICVYGGAIATVCLTAFNTKSGVVPQILDITSSTEGRLHLLLHNYRPPVWAILAILWASGMFLAVLSTIALAKKGFIVIKGGRDPIWVAAGLSIVLIISAVGFTWKGIRDFHDTRKIAELQFERLLPAPIERVFGGPP